MSVLRIGAVDSEVGKKPTYYDPRKIELTRTPAPASNPELWMSLSKRGFYPLGVYDEDNEVVWMDNEVSMRMTVSLDLSASLRPGSSISVEPIEFITTHNKNVYWFPSLVAHNAGKYIISFDVPDRSDIPAVSFECGSEYVDEGSTQRKDTKAKKPQEKPVEVKQQVLKLAAADGQSKKRSHTKKELHDDEPAIAKDVIPTVEPEMPSKRSRLSESAEEPKVKASSRPKADDKKALLSSATTRTEEASVMEKPEERPIKKRSRNSKAVQDEITVPRPVDALHLEGDLCSLRLSPLLTGYLYDDYYGNADNALTNPGLSVSEFIAQSIRPPQKDIAEQLESLFNGVLTTHVLRSEEKASKSIKIRLAKRGNKTYAGMFPVTFLLRFLVCLTKLDDEGVDEAARLEIQDAVDTLCGAIETKARSHDPQIIIG